jgi:hypothetical protein
MNCKTKTAQASRTITAMVLEEETDAVSAARESSSSSSCDACLFFELQNSLQDSVIKILHIVRCHLSRVRQPGTVLLDK